MKYLKYISILKSSKKFNVFLSISLLLTISFSIVSITKATTPNPGHGWSQTGDGVFAITGPTSLHTYTFPDTDATVVTTANNLSSLSSTTSLQLLNLISDETGTGNAVFSISPVFTTPNIGVATGTSLDLSSGVITSGLINGQTISSTANFTGTVNIASNVGIGTTTSAQSNGAIGLTTYGPRGTPLTNLHGQNMQIISVDSTAQNIGTGGGIGFMGKYNDAGDLISFASILGQKANSTSGDYAANLVFAVRKASGSFNERMRIEGENGNVGIGTTSPTAKLDVARIGAGDVAFFRNTGNYGLAFSVDGSNNNQISNIQTNTSLNYWVAGTGVQTFSTGGLERFRVDSTGNVGIGMTNPGYKLEVNGSINAGAVLVNGVPVATGGSTQWGNNSAMIYYNGGNVGLGTTAPQSNLQISGATVGLTVTDTGAGADSKNWAIQSNGGLFRIRAINDVYSAGLNALVINRTGVSSVTSYFENGNVGIGTMSPTNILHVVKTGNTNASITAENTTVGDSVYAGFKAITDGGTSYFYRTSTGHTIPDATVIQDSGGGDIIFNGTGELMRIKNTGNVGIGTMTPGGKLEVAGGNDVVITRSIVSNTYPLVDPATGGGGAALRIVSGSGRTSAIDFGHFDGGGAYVGSWGVGVKRQSSGNDFWIWDGTDDTNRFAIQKSSGNVGIGTTNPTTVLTLGTTDPVISTGTSDAADNKRILLTGGGDAGSIRGALIQFAGNEYAGYTGGSAIFDTGIIANAFIKFRTSTSGGGAQTETMFLQNGNVGIGTTAPGYKLEVQGSIFNNGGFEFRDSGTPDVDGVRIFNSAHSLYLQGDGIVMRSKTAAALMTIQNGGNVGIGTTTPTTGKLEVNGTIAVTSGVTGQLFNSSVSTSGGYFHMGSAGTDQYWGTESSVGGTIFSGTSAYASVFGNKDNVPIQFVTTNVARMTILGSSGNVGIGTTGPGSTLDIQTSQTATDANVLNIQNTGSNSGNQSTIFTIKTANTGTGYLRVNSSGGTQTLGTSSDMFLMNAYTAVANTGGLMFGTQNTVRMSILGNGNVGIGTTNPGAKLEISDTSGYNQELIRLTHAEPTRYQGRFSLTTTDGLPRLSIGTVRDANDFSQTLNLKDGNVGIGTTSPWARLEVQNAVSSTVLGDNYWLKLSGGGGSTNNYQQIGMGYVAGTSISPVIVGARTVTQTGFTTASYFIATRNVITDTAPTERFVVDPAGNVGIGTTGPLTVLQVSDGFVKTDTTNRNVLFVGSNEAQASNPFGLMTWVTGAAALANRSVSLQTTDFNSASGGNLILQSGGGNVGIGYPDPGTAKLAINGNVGIGTTAPGVKLEVEAGNASGFKLNGYSGVADNAGELELEGWHGVNVVLDRTNGYSDRVFTISHNASLIGGGSPTELFRVQENGNVGIGFTNPSGALAVNGHVGIGRSDPTQANLSIVSNLETLVPAIYILDADASTGGNYINFGNSLGASAGTISHNGTSTVAYNTSSDQRLKENIVPTHYGLTDLMNIQVSDYSFISDPNHIAQNGFIAQQLNTVYPNAVTVGGDDFNKNPWMVDYGRLTPLLVKSIQDLNLNLESMAQPIPTINSFGERFFSNLFTRLIAWFADSANGIGKFFAGEVNTKSLCVSDDSGAKTCVNKNQLDALLINNGTTGTPTADTTAPIITLMDSTGSPQAGEATINLSVGDVYTEQGATALDNVDSSVDVTISGSVDTLTIGTYLIKYNAKDAAGNNAIEAIRTIVVN